MNNPEFFRLVKGERIRKSMLEWENPLGMENVNKMIKSGDVVGQATFDMRGHLDFIYWMPGKVKGD